MSTITATVDGQTLVVDLARVTGLDAIAYRGSVGDNLDLVVAGWLEAGGIVALADVAIVKWLWWRQNIDPMVPLADVAASVTLLPTVPEDD